MRLDGKENIMDIIKILTSNIAIIIYESIALALLIANSFRLKGRNKKVAEMVSLQKDRIREENLDAALQNTLHSQAQQGGEIANNPYDVTYHEEEVNVYDDTRERISLQIEEKGILSTKKYVVHVFDSILIGNDDSNKIVLNDLSVSKFQIQLTNKDNKLYAHNLDCSNDAHVLRKKKKYPLAQDMVCIQSNDYIQVGNTSLRLTII